MNMLVRRLGIGLLVCGVVACKTPPPPAPVPVAVPAPAPVAVVPPPPPVATNPAVAELAPLWPQIAQCEDIAELYAAEKCPANLQLMNITHVASADEPVNPERLKQVYGALLDQVLHGTDTKARTCAAYAAWSKAYRGGEAFAKDVKTGLAVADAIGALAAETGSLGTPMANMINHWWQVDGEVRKRMVRVMLDRNTKSTAGRSELVRQGSWVAKDAPLVLEAIRTLAQRDDDDLEVRIAAIDALGGVVAKLPDHADVLLLLSADANPRVAAAAVGSLAGLKPDAPLAAAAQVRLLQLIENGPPSLAADRAQRAIGSVCDLAGFKRYLGRVKDTTANRHVMAALRDVVRTVCARPGIRDDALFVAELRKAIDLGLADNAIDDWGKRDMLAALGALGGAKSKARCSKFTADTVPDVATAAAACVAHSGK